ncbi:helix-turn-helix domain-containing protein [Pseudoxanthomonas beigongshangi]
MDTVGSRVKEARSRRGISRTELSRLTGVGYSTIAELENGGMQTSTKLRVMAEALKVSLRWLETGKGAADLAAPDASQPTGLQREIVSIGVRAVNIMREAGMVEVTPENYSDLLFRAMKLAQDLGVAESATELEVVKLARVVADNSG